MSVWIWVVVLVDAIGCAGFCHNLAKAKNLDSGNAALVGFFFGPIALLYYVGVPIKESKAKPLPKLTRTYDEIVADEKALEKKGHLRGRTSDEKARAAQQKREQMEKGRGDVPRFPR